MSACKRAMIEREERERAEREDAHRERLARATARHVLVLWNTAVAAGWRATFYPTIGTALRNGCHWLHVICPACQQIGEADLRKVDIHRDATLAVVLRLMSCQRCCPNPPFAVPLGATRRSWYGKDWKPTIQKKTVNLRAERDEDGWGRTQIARKRDR